jgi:hypothetical protein
VEPNRTLFRLANSGVVNASSPVKFAELPIRKEYIPVSVVISRPVPVLETELTDFRIEAFTDESAISPYLVDCVTR